MLSVIALAHLNQRIIVGLLGALGRSAQRLQFSLQADVHALQQRPHLRSLAVVLGQVLQAAAVDLLQVGLALRVVGKHLVEQADGVVGAHHRGEHQPLLLLLVGFLKVL
jgi:hypothetical protein